MSTGDDVHVPTNTIVKMGGVARLQAFKDSGERELAFAAAQDKEEEQGGDQEQLATAVLEGEDEERVKQSLAAEQRARAQLDADGSSSSSSDDDQEDEASVQLWLKVESVLEEYHLSRFALAAAKRWVRLMGDPDNSHLERIKGWLLLKINNRMRAKPSNDWQGGCPEIIAGLRALPFWEVEAPEMQWLREVEACYDDVRDELLQLRGQDGFQPYRQPAWSTKIASPDIGAVSHDSGDWNVFYLFLHNQRFEENCARCPKTCKLIERVAPRQYKHAFFSALQPGTHVIAHTGPTNKKLRCHMPVVGVEGSRLRVGSETREQQAGKCYVFDDSFEHEAWHDGKSTRIVLIFDIWHPDFSDEEIKFLSYLQKSQMKEEERLSANDDSEDNFYSVLRKTKNMKLEASWWIGDQ